MQIKFSKIYLSPSSPNFLLICPYDPGPQSRSINQSGVCNMWQVVVLIFEENLQPLPKTLKLNDLTGVNTYFLPAGIKEGSTTLKIGPLFFDGYIL